MNKLFYSLLLFTITYSGLAQNSYYSIKLKDKEASKTLTPNQFLSEKAIERRRKQNIAITEQDYPVSLNYKNQIIDAASNNIDIKATLKWTNEIIIETNDVQLIQRLSTFPFIDRIIYLGKAKGNSKKSTQNKFSVEESYTPDYGVPKVQVSMIGVDKLHEKGYTGRGQLIAVFDAGFRYVDKHKHFETLWLNNQILGFKDFVNKTDSVFYSSNHGMNVLSTMSCSSEGELIGTAPHANYWLMLTEDVTSETIIEEYYWAQAAEMADSLGADIINSSLGYTTFDDASTSHTYQDMDGNTTPVTKAANTAFEKGILVVSSAGNSGAQKWRYIGAPADGKNVIGVGAVNENEEIAPFSSRGPSAIGAVKPDVCGMGWLAYFVSPVDDIRRGNGTSFAGPVIAGAAASLWQAYPELNNQQIKDAITQSAHLYSNPNPGYGYGIPNFNNALNLLEKERFPDDVASDVKNNFLLFPNPTINGSTRIEFIASDNNLSISIKIYGTNGQIVLNRKYKSIIGHNFISVNINNLESGSYIVEFDEDGSISRKKLLVVNKND